MKVEPENIDDIVTLVAHKFPSFGGGEFVAGNPISAALANSEAKFAAGVSIKKVTQYIIELHNKIRSLP